MAAFSVGQTAEARERPGTSIANLPDGLPHRSPRSMRWQGDEAQTFVWLDRAIAIRDPGLTGIQNRPEFDKFKGDPRFERVLRLMNVAD